MKNKMTSIKKNLASALLALSFTGLAVFFSLSMTGCSGKKTKKITFALDWTPNTNHTGLYVARDKGFFAEEGLEVEIVQPSEDGAEIMVATGRAQFGVGFQDSIAPALCQKESIPLTAVAALLQHNTSGLISLKSSGIDRPRALEGKKYATWESPVELATVHKVMENDGGDFSKLQLIPSTVYDVVTALNTEIDCVWIYYAWDGIKMEIEGYDTNYLDFGKIDPVFDYYTPIIISGTEFLKKEGDTARAFLRALAKGYEWSVANPDEAAEILCKAAPELDPKLVHASQKWINDYYISDAKQWGYIEAERWNRFFRWLNDTKLMPGTLQENKGFTNEYLN